MQADPRHPPTDAPGDSPSAIFYRPPRLGIIHLLAWIAVTAGLLSMTTSLCSLVGGPPRLEPPFSRLYQFALAQDGIQSIMLAAALIGTFVILRDRLRRVPGRLQPGHWFLLAFCLASAAGTLKTIALALVWLIGSLDQQTPTKPLVLMAAMSIAASLMTMAVLLAGAIRCPAGRLWRVLFVFRAFAHAAAMVFAAGVLAHHFLQSNGPPFPWSRTLYLATVAAANAVPFVLLTVAAARDVMTRTRRDWIHWLGVALLFLSTLWPLFQWGGQLLVRMSR